MFTKSSGSFSFSEQATERKGTTGRFSHKELEAKRRALGIAFAAPLNDPFSSSICQTQPGGGNSESGLLV